MKKILIILYKFPPSNDVGAFRPIKFIKHLNQFGWHPIILAPSNGVYFSYDFDLEKSIQNKCRIYRTPMFFPYKKSDAFIASKINRVKHLLWRIWNRLAIPDGAISWLPFAIPAGITISQKYKIDLVFVSGPPFSTFIMASYIKRKTKKKLILDYRDPWTINPFDRSWPIRRWFEKQFEKFVLRSADAVICSTNEIREFQIEGLNIKNANHKFYTITNSFEESDDKVINAHTSKKFVVIHAGNLYRNRNPEVLFRGMSMAASQNETFARNTKFIFYGVFDSKRWIKLGERLGIRSMLSFKSRIPQSQLFPLLQQASVLLLINSYGPGHHIFIPAKFFDYLKAHRPILCLSEQGALTQVINQTESGVVVNPRSPAEIARELLNLFDQIHVRKAPFIIDKNKIAEYESFQTTKSLADICNKVISGGHTHMN
jgi:glycosyltransferase involved in cell wall biosynthesis